MHSPQPPGVVQNWSTLQCSKQNTEQCGYDHAPVTRGRMRAQFPLPHGPARTPLHPWVMGGQLRAVYEVNIPKRCTAQTRSMQPPPNTLTEMHSRHLW